MIVVPACYTCQHFFGESLDEPQIRCAAFPEGIPEVIAKGEERHETPFPGDHGLQYLRLPTKLYVYEHPVREKEPVAA